eukprot:Sspe_Gene.105714::Locus_82760_Transcript_1_1_Confidence_1.000_Length_413::g.105714::m.105714
MLRRVALRLVPLDFESGALDVPSFRGLKGPSPKAWDTLEGSLTRTVKDHRRSSGVSEEREDEKLKVMMMSPSHSRGDSAAVLEYVRRRREQPTTHPSEILKMMVQNGWTVRCWCYSKAISMAYK